MPVVIALHASWGERALELTRSTSLNIVTGSVIQHFENLLPASTVLACHSPPTHSLRLPPPSLSVSPSASLSFLHASSSLLLSACFCQLTPLDCFHANVLWYNSHVSQWL